MKKTITAKEIAIKNYKEYEIFNIDGNDIVMFFDDKYGWVYRSMVEYAKQKCREQRSLCFHNYEKTPAVLLSAKKGQPKRYYMDCDVILDAPEPEFKEIAEEKECEKSDKKLISQAMKEINAEIMKTKNTCENAYEDVILFCRQWDYDWQEYDKGKSTIKPLHIEQFIEKIKKKFKIEIK